MTSKGYEGNYKKRFTTEERKKESKRIVEKYPDRYPVIVEISYKSIKDLPPLDRQKYLVPGDLTIGQFCYVIRKRMKLNPNKALFLSCGNILPASSQLINNIYDEHKDVDGFIYFVISGENTFGNF